MQGMSRDTGKVLGEDAHIAQSLQDIVTTPKGSRVMRRDYGIDLNLIDQPATAPNLLRLYAEIIHTIQRWEPRIAIRRVNAQVQNNGVVSVLIETISNQTYQLNTVRPST